MIIWQAYDSARCVGQFESLIKIVAQVIPGHEKRVADQVAAVFLEQFNKHIIHMFFNLQVVERCLRLFKNVFRIHTNQFIN